MTEFSTQSKPEVTCNLETLSLIRTLDLIVAGIGIVLLVPVFLIIAVTIKFSTKGSIFHKAKRVGRDGQLFDLYRFRTKYVVSEQRRAKLKTGDNPELTPVGRFLQRTRLAELPQLINIWRGELSLVGPRPLKPRPGATFSPVQRQLLTVPPGLISPAALGTAAAAWSAESEGRVNTPQARSRSHRQALELVYLQRRTIWTDVRVVLQAMAPAINLAQHFNAILQLRNRHFFLLDTLALLLIPALALTLRLDGFGWCSHSVRALVLFTIMAILVKLPIFYRLGLYRRFWCYAGVNDLVQVLIAVGWSTVILTVVFIYAHQTLLEYGLAMYRAVPFIDGLLTAVAVGGFRLGLRGLYHRRRQRRCPIGGRRVLIVGAGEAGTIVVRELQANPELNMEPVAFVDDDPAKGGTRIQDLPVVGTSVDIPRLVGQYQIQRMVVAMPSTPLKRRQEIIARCQQTNLPTYSLPGIYELLAGHKTINNLPQVDINHLLRREPVVTGQTEISAVLRGATVLVTGAGGSIGSELCRQIARCNPAAVILLGHGENSIFEIGLDLRLAFPNLVTHSVIVDVRDRLRVDEVIDKYRPELIFHAAAHKHVPFMEANITEAITNNVLGTQNVLRAAEQYGVKRFVFISTDKAVNPSGVMGATKRLAEMLVVATAQRSGRSYIAVRFGNVLGSRGSVIPIFQRQIAAGGPLTITHPDMCRYFMTIPEAVQLVLQASVLGQGGEVFVLDMGQPVKIMDLATDLIKLSGLKPERDIKIVCSGIRPGEKLCEELFLESEAYRRTNHRNIFMAAPDNPSLVAALEQVAVELIYLTRRLWRQSDLKRLRTVLLEVCRYIDKYQPQFRSPPLKPTVTSETSWPDRPYPKAIPP